MYACKPFPCWPTRHSDRGGTNGGAFRKAESSCVAGLCSPCRRWPDEAARISKRATNIFEDCLYTASLVVCTSNRDARVGGWITELKGSKPSNVATVAMANKLSAHRWSVLYRNEVYRRHGSVYQRHMPNARWKRGKRFAFPHLPRAGYDYDFSHLEVCEQESR